MDCEKALQTVHSNLGQFLIVVLDFGPFPVSKTNSAAEPHVSWICVDIESAVPINSLLQQSPENLMQLANRL